METTPPQDTQQNPDGVVRHVCAACHSVWPEQMMTNISSRWICLPCKDNVLQTQKAPGEERYRMSMGVPNFGRWVVILSVLGPILILGMRMFLIESAREPALVIEKSDPNIPRSGFESSEETSWSSKDFDKWPAMLAQSQATFTHPFLKAAPNVFFLESDAGKVVGVSSLMLTGTEKDTEDLDATKAVASLKEWKVQAGGQSLTFSKMRIPTQAAEGSGVVILEMPGKAPVETLKARPHGYSAGMKFKVVGNDGGKPKISGAVVMGNDSADGSVKVTTYRSKYAGTHTSTSGDGSATIVELQRAMKPSEINGAPLIDHKGLVAAVIVGPIDAEQADHASTTYVAFGMDALLQALASKVDVFVEKKEEAKPAAAPVESVSAAPAAPPAAEPTAPAAEAAPPAAQ